MDPVEFNDVYLHDVLEKISNENKTGTNGKFQNRSFKMTQILIHLSF